MDDFGADVVALLDAVGEVSATVVGHSMGSLVARRVAVTYRDRVERLVLVGSSYTFLNEGTGEFRDAVHALVDAVPADVARAFQGSALHVPVPANFLDRARLAVGAAREGRLRPHRLLVGKARRRSRS